MAEIIEIPVTDLKTGMKIVNRGGRTITLTEVKSITPCTQTVLRGIPKIHVNSKDCYHTICRVEIYNALRKA